MTRPAASVVVPLLEQHDAWLEQCVLSAVHQDDCEVIVVVSHAAAPSNLRVLGAIARRFGSLQILPRAAGAAGTVGAAINAGIEAARATRVGLLASGDWLEPGAMAAACAVTADIVGTGTTVHGAVAGPRRAARTHQPSAAGLATLTTAAARARYLSPCLLFDRTMLQAIGGFDEHVADADDYAVICRHLPSPYPSAVSYPPHTVHPAGTTAMGSR